MKKKSFEWRELAFPVVSLLAVLLYEWISFRQLGPGFPLDDAWIHMTYARNFAVSGQWTFLPGVVSGGSTSPLWTFLLTPTFYFHIPLWVWVAFLGVTTLTFLAFLTYRLLCHFIPRDIAFITAIVISFEWHFVWAALSGMETALQTLGNLLVALWLCHIYLHSSRINLWLIAGGLIGMLIWIRPDSLTWLGPAFVLAAALIVKNPALGMARIWRLLLGFSLPFAAYLIFNLQIAGSIWPNTLYAKQAEYHVMMQIPVWLRYMRLFSLPLVGSTILLLPGLVFYLVETIRKRDLLPGVYFAWWLGIVALYALKLPVTYQHGRYMIPGMILPMILGVIGSVRGFQALKLNPDWKRRLAFGGAALWIALQLAFFLLGAKAFSEDVGVIQTEMVATARWVAEHIPQGKKLAVHDIGAMGYFSQHPFIDLAGLINPELIPILRDEDALADYLSAQQVDYVIVFPHWYVKLTAGHPILYSTGAGLSPSLGGENMTIYCWDTCP